MDPLKIFFHVATLSRWSHIYDQIVTELEESGLLKHANLSINVCGSHCDKHIQPPHTLKILTHDTNQYEYPTLRELWLYSQTNPGSVLYLHTKGATRPGHQVDAWRKMMLHFNVTKWREAIHHLNDHDAVGCNMQRHQNREFFSGNFWWAKTSYIKTLPDPNAYLKIRTQAEFWIGMGNGKLKTLHNSGINHYRETYSPDKYLNL